MQSFDSLDELYSYLEENILSLKNYKIANLFKNFKSIKLKENSIEEAKKAQLEQLFFDFNAFYGNEALFSDKKGQIFKIYDLVKPEDYDYFILRLQNTKNPLLKSHYAKILWFSPKKHGKYGKIIVNSNFDLFKLYKKEIIEDKSSGKEFILFNCLKNAYSISYQLDYEKDSIKSTIMSLIKEENFLDRAVIGYLIVNWMWEKRKRFDREDFKDLNDVCWKLAKIFADEGQLFDSINILEHGLKIEHKLQTSKYEWRKEIASNYESLVKKNEKNNKFNAIRHCLLAIKYYKIVKDTTKVEELENKYKKLITEVEYKKASVRLDAGIFIKTIEDKVQEILQYEPEELILFLMLSVELLPYYLDINKMTEDNAKKLPILSASTRVVMDQSGHPAKYFKTEEERKYFDLVFNYQLYLELYCSPLISRIFFDSIAQNKLSAEILIEFLREKSWISKDLDKQFDNKKIKYNWLAGITPAILDYFRQVELFMVNPDYANFILCVDSLVLKIEGIVRDLCRFNGIITSKIDKNNKLIKKEKDINELLNEEKLKEVLSIDDILFLKILLIEQSGYNLRNRIAHSLIEPYDYSIETANLLLLAILRLLKYEWKNE
jgi:hypothetical protein